MEQSALILVVTAFVALLAVALVVHTARIGRRRRSSVRAARTSGRSAVSDLDAWLDVDQPVLDVWPTLVSTMLGELALADCRFVPGPVHDLPLIARCRTTGPIERRHEEFVLPPCGAAIPVTYGGAALGSLVVTPRHGAGSLRISRSVVHELADSVGLAVSRAAALAGASSTARD